MPPLHLRPASTILALGIALLAGACDRADLPGPDTDPTTSAPAVEPGAVASALAPAADAPPEKPRPKPVEPDASLRIDINLPAGRLDLFKDGVLQKSYPVSPGYKPYETPVGTLQMRRMIWNPWWDPPKSEWAKNRKKTPPGPSNPMGRAKLHLTELIYIHGTTATSKLGRPASHGCIRMSNDAVLELARIIASHTRALDGTTVAKLEGNSKITRELALPRSIPVTIRYERAEIRDGSLIVYRDIYGRAYDPKPSALRAWTAAGRDPSTLTREVIAAAIARANPPKPAAPPEPKLLGRAVDAPPPADSIRPAEAPVDPAEHRVSGDTITAG